MLARWTEGEKAVKS